MKKVALVFIAAVFLPSLVLAWLAVRSLRDQQFVIERQQSLLYQQVTDGLAKDAENVLAEMQHQFGQQVEALLAEDKTRTLPTSFNDRLRTNWSISEIGFVVTLEGNILCPTPYASPTARTFREQNSKFLCNSESAEVYWNASKLNNLGKNYSNSSQPEQQPQLGNNFLNLGQNSSSPVDYKNTLKSQGMRNVMPQQQASQQNESDSQLYSKVSASEAEFRQLVGDATEGTIARFVDNRLNVLVWYRPPGTPQMIFGSQLSLLRIKQELKTIIDHLEPALRDEIAVALLDDNARPVTTSREKFQTVWKRPFVATEVGEALPHWEIAVYLLDPAKMSQSARTLKLTLGLLIAVLVCAIGFGSLLIVTDLRRQLAVARKKTDFVSNVSHELKTPLTSIRMFSELLAEGRIADPVKQRSYLHIITAEAARLTRLINNVLDFSRMERGEKKYSIQKLDLLELITELAGNYRHHLEANHFQLNSSLPDAPVFVNGDRDALAQVIVNLLSNAEKYSAENKEVSIILDRKEEPLPYAEIQILDRGIGVPKGSEDKIFEQFYRAHDSLGSGIQGSGLGLTLARQIARAHGGDVINQSREGGGSCFTLRLPIIQE
ncbi:sensor histidine kinase [Pedosphaera parvula]|uniref:histidine kinase n=1 Tax=Pedosphaera parvula (strain Ellin514) TaxID=320771 RepID=B9XG92_PEDPL|nr:HAMP domain-containing sensor histidine kinase [Pedosphaera parvula]EEF61254.1 integral membrane sensor signal transduction histidine kinase [Pedosphaera parvula Ellin514]